MTAPRLAPLLLAALASLRSALCTEACGDTCPARAAGVLLLQRQDGLQLFQDAEAEAAAPPPPEATAAAGAEGAEGGSLVESGAELRKRAAMCRSRRLFGTRAADARATQATDTDPTTLAIEKAMLQRMAANPTDFHLQTQSCLRFSIQLSGGSGQELAPLLSAMDAAVGAALAATPPSLETATMCLNSIINPAVFNRPYTLLLNRTTHAMEHLITMLEMFPANRTLNEYWLQMIAVTASLVAPELTPVVHRLGGFDVLAKAIERYRNDPNVTMSAWRGLSDHSHNPYGAAVIANYGGPLQGIKFIVNELRRQPQPYLAESPYDHLTLHYEIMQIAYGLLQFDSANVYGAAFEAAGFIPQVLYAMRVEPDLRGTQQVGCDCMNSLLDHSANASRTLTEQGAVPVVWAAVRRFRGVGDSTPWCGTTLGAAYPVVPNCLEVLRHLAAANPEAQRQLQALAGKDTL